MLPAKGDAGLAAALEGVEEGFPLFQWHQHPPPPVRVDQPAILRIFGIYDKGHSYSLITFIVPLKTGAARSAYDESSARNTKTVDLKQVNAVLLQPHWRHNPQYEPQPPILTSNHKSATAS